MREPVPLRSRIARFISRAFATRMPVGWILPPVAAVAILAWMILFPRSGGNLLGRSPLPSPPTAELSGRPAPEAERALQSFRADVRRSTPQPSPQRPFDVPTLVITGSQDILTPVGDAEELAETIPGAELVIVPGAAHAVMVDRAPAFNEAVLSFLDRHRATADDADASPAALASVNLPLASA